MCSLLVIGDPSHVLIKRFYIDDPVIKNVFFLLLARCMGNAELEKKNATSHLDSRFLKQLAIDFLIIFAYTSTTFGFED